MLSDVMLGIAVVGLPMNQQEVQHLHVIKFGQRNSINLKLVLAYERQGHGYSSIGENIWWSNEAYLRPNLQSAMLDFFNERPYYDYSTNECMKGAQCGHFTQVLINNRYDSIPVKAGNWFQNIL